MLGRHEQLLDGGREASLQQHRSLGPSALGEQGVVLHVAGAHLEHIGVSGDELHLTRVEHLGDDRKPGQLSRLGEDQQRVGAEPLKRVRRGAGFEGAAPEHDSAAGANPSCHREHHLATFDRAGSRNHDKRSPADENPSCLHRGVSCRRLRWDAIGGDRDDCPLQTSVGNRQFATQESCSCSIG